MSMTRGNVNVDCMQNTYNSQIELVSAILKTLMEKNSFSMKCIGISYFFTLLFLLRIFKY